MFPYSTKPTDRTMNNEQQFARLWREFNRQFKTEKDCMEELYRILKDEEVLSCKNCSGKDMKQAYGARLRTCSLCGQEISITAGTFFDGIRKARPWLAAIWFLEQGIILSASRFHKLLEIAYSTAWMIQKKVSFTLKQLIDQEESAVVVSAEMFHSAICKRSRETLAQKHPNEIAENNTSISSSEIDSSSTLFKASVEKPDSSETAILPSPHLICDTFHGISRKYLQTYLDLLWCGADRNRWSTNQLFAYCCRFRKVLESEILTLSSASHVRVIPASNQARS